jgi:GAF domain-containing protein
MENSLPNHIATLSKSEKYNLFNQYWEGLTDFDVDWVANFSNAAALMKEIFNWWWVGFYRVQDNQLVLTTFQGPSACTKIAFGKGVCGKSWENQQTIVVPNVHDFEGHIACSSTSNSEIVVPIWKNNEIWGVLDVDSEFFDHFDPIDKENLEIICSKLAKHL